MTDKITKVEVLKFTPEDKKNAKTLEKEISTALDLINSHETDLATHYVQMGIKLESVRARQYWILWGHQSFGRYIDTIKEKVHKGRTQIYATISVAEKLLPHVSESDLEKMGISKALELKKLVSKTGCAPSPEILAKALDPKVDLKELRAEIFKNQNSIGEDKGVYFDLGGFWVTEEEKKEIEDVFQLAAKTDPVIDKALPEWAQRKEVIQRLCMEFQSTYSEVPNE